MTDLTPKEMAERLVELAEKATEGPWVRRDAEHNGTLGNEWVSQPFPVGAEWYDEIAICGELTRYARGQSYRSEEHERKANATFIAEARTLAPAVAAWALELAEEVGRLRERAEWCDWLEDNTSKAFDGVTHGRISKPNTDYAVVVQVSEQVAMDCAADEESELATELAALREKVERLEAVLAPFLNGWADDDKPDAHVVYVSTPLGHLRRVRAELEGRDDG